MATQRANHQAAIQRRAQDAVIIKYERRIAREIARAMRDAVTRYYAGDIAVPLDVARNAHAMRLNAIMADMWREAGEAMTGAIPMLKRANGRREVKDFFTAPNATAAAANFILIYGGQRITEISDTTIADVNQVISEGIESGLDERAIARMVRAVAPIKSASRAQTIARTETAAAASYTAQSIAELGGIDMVRVWVAADVGGERTRKAHSDADGQERGMHEPFNVGGELLMYPGDPAGSAHNVINCRCQVVFDLPE